MNLPKTKAAARRAFGDCAVLTGMFAIGTRGGMNAIMGAGAGDRLTEDGVSGRVAATVIVIVHDGEAEDMGWVRRRR